jgi:8-oxo-dGTP pyrophosphatase MutT (NUDIX family)
MGHIHGLIDFTTSGYIVHKNKVLLLHHKKIGLWLQPGGHIELNEDPLQALLRELQEETGLSATDLEIIDWSPNRPADSPDYSGGKSLPVPFDLNVHNFNAGHQHIDLGYLVRAKTDHIHLEAEAAHSIGWFTKSQMRQKVADGVMFAHTYDFAVYALQELANK